MLVSAPRFAACGLSGAAANSSYALSSSPGIGTSGGAPLAAEQLPPHSRAAGMPPARFEEDASFFDVEPVTGQVYNSLERCACVRLVI